MTVIKSLQLKSFCKRKSTLNSKVSQRFILHGHKKKKHTYKTFRNEKSLVLARAENYVNTTSDDVIFYLKENKCKITSALAATTGIITSVQASIKSTRLIDHNQV